MSGEALTPPCVIDELGTLYNKDAVVSALLNKNMPEPMSSYLTSLKNVIELRLERNPNANKWVELLLAPVRCIVWGVEVWDARHAHNAAFMN